MLRSDDEVRVERPGRPGVGSRARQLVEEAFDQVERRVRLDRLIPGTEPGEGRQRRGRERGQGAGLVDRRRPRQVLGRAPGRDGGPQRVHRLGRCREGAQHGHDRAAGSGRSRSRWVGVPVAGPQQVRDGRVGPVGDEVADPVAAVQQPAALAIDEAQAGLARHDAGKARGVRPFDGRCVGHAAMVALPPFGRSVPNGTTNRPMGAARDGAGVRAALLAHAA